MWVHRFHMLFPLLNLASNKLYFRFNHINNISFDNIIKSVIRYVLLSYTKFNKYFDMHTDSRLIHLGSGIIQEVKPIAFTIENWIIHKLYKLILRDRFLI